MKAFKKKGRVLLNHGHNSSVTTVFAGQAQLHRVCPKRFTEFTVYVYTPLVFQAGTAESFSLMKSNERKKEKN